MIFLPRDADDFIDAAAEERKIGLKTTQADRNAYELTALTAKEYRDYEPILEAAVQVTDQSDTLFQAVEWVKKTNCIVILTSNLDQTVKGLAGKGITLSAQPIAEKPFVLTHEFIRDRSEFEAIADSIATCVSDPDKIYLGYDSKRRKHAILWSTPQSSQRQECIKSAGEIRLESG